jgi:hypothetical protein
LLPVNRLSPIGAACDQSGGRCAIKIAAQVVKIIAQHASIATPADRHESI